MRRGPPQQTSAFGVGPITLDVRVWVEADVVSAAGQCPLFASRALKADSPLPAQFLTRRFP